VRGILSRSFKTLAKLSGVGSPEVRSAVNKFCESNAFVYLGSVSQHDDDHSIIRGFTASAQHRDEHFAVGNYEDYNTSIVYRTDSTIDSTSVKHTHSWLVVEMKLNSEVDVPHIFMGTHRHDQASPYAKIFTTAASFQPVPLGSISVYPQDFISRYTLFCNPSHFIDSEQIFTPEVASVMAAHFWPLSLEIENGYLYMYYDGRDFSAGLIQTMVQNSAWFADILDKHADS